MLISFFPTSYETGIDYSSHPDCIGVHEVDCDLSIHIPTLVDWQVVLINRPAEPIPPETAEQRRTRKIEEFISAWSIVDFDWEDIVLHKDDYSRLITVRDFDNDAWAQAAMSAKTDMKHIAMFLWMGVPLASVQAMYAEEIQKIQAVSNTRVALGLNPFDLSFLN
jgi:hypothetical protein